MSAWEMLQLFLSLKRDGLLGGEQMNQERDKMST